MVKQWLKAGVIEKGRLSRTEEGTPQGGVVSPVLLNVALHGMEQAAGVRYKTTGTNAGLTVTGSSPVLVRYADDLVALCHSRPEALEVKARLASWLAPRGLVFNEDKTRVVCLDDGFDFLGFNVRRYHGKLLIMPSKAAIRRARDRLRTEMRSLRGTNIAAVLKRLNPIIRGWSAYYRGVVSSEVFSALDDYMWKLTHKWATFSHSNKSKRWVIARYFGMFNKSRRDRWVFGDRDSGAYLRKFAWTRIVRHQMVKGAASPDDPALADYWANRRRKVSPPPISTTNLQLFEAQDGRCLLCGGSLLDADDLPQSPREWEQWLAATQQAIVKVALREHGTSNETKPRLIHPQCRSVHHARTGKGPELLPAREPSGLA
jgi:RNA-directed DNA polymerase